MVNSGIDWTEVRFVKSSYSGTDQGNCVELGVAADTVGVRDSKLGAASPVLELDKTAFQAFLDQAKTGGFDRPA
ncbi:DUF397 domain-containing protein [Gandjariella thermophila]|uniref:DUF397 domain-containing protein n=1 Tax=Gandjariella thermophila TaxID=1931992 RepID=A0A4D4JBG5_9PSEU|nr:DUF397 domain-containing protein [Gandjariella thermophila]GDY32914.1 hypothetical protein GTS_45470 [Gandjariella thermophila]